MSDIVVFKDNEFFINSENLALLSENEHRAVTQLIRNYMSELEYFGVMTFEMSKPNELGGRPKKVYFLNEHQATLLVTFMKNSEKVKQFKIKLVDEFFKMREFINSKKITRAIGKETRKTLTDAINDSGENERMHGRGYSNYTRLVYSLTGLTSAFKQFKSDQKIVTGYDKLNFRDVLKPEELKRVELAESLIKPMLELEKEYNEIKETIKPLFEVKEIE